MSHCVCNNNHQFVGALMCTKQMEEVNLNMHICEKSLQEGRQLSS